MENVLTGFEDAAEKASGLEDLVSLSQRSQLSESLHPSRARPRAQVSPIDIERSFAKKKFFKDLLMNSSAPPRLSTSNASITFSLDSSILQVPKTLNVREATF